MIYKRLHMMMYFEENGGKRFNNLRGNTNIEMLFDFLQEETQVHLMIQSSKEKRPALEGVIENIEQTFQKNKAYDLLNNMRHRQITGSMVRYIMGHYGYYPGKAKPLKKGSYIRTAIVYQH